MEMFGYRVRPKKKRIDRLSSLPDEILCHILSFLPTVEAAGTSTLSHRWIDIWTRVPVLHFEKDYCEYGIDPDDKMEYLDCVDMAMSQNRAPKLEKFRFRFSDYENVCLDYVNGLVDNAVSREVVELDLHLDFKCDDEFDEEVFVNALTLKPSNSLEVLKINGEVSLEMPSSGCYNNLKKFHIHLLGNVDNELTSKLFSSLPQLEELKMSLKDMARCTDLNIVAPVLKLLDIDLVGEDFDGIPHFSVLIDAPMLEYITLKDNFLASYTIRNVPSNARAKIAVGGDITYDYDGGLTHANRAIELLSGLSSVKYLSIAESTMKAIAIANADNLPTFHGLRKLQLFVPPSMGKLLPRYLNSAPKLESLVLELEGNMNLDKEREQDCIISETCKMLHLKEVEVHGSGMTRGLPILKFIMQNAEAMEKFVVNSLGFL